MTSFQDRSTFYFRGHPIWRHFFALFVKPGRAMLKPTYLYKTVRRHVDPPWNEIPRHFCLRGINITMASLYRWYNGHLMRRPMLTQCVSTAVSSRSPSCSLHWWLIDIDSFRCWRYIGATCRWTKTYERAWLCENGTICCIWRGDCWTVDGYLVSPLSFTCSLPHLRQKDLSIPHCILDVVLMEGTEYWNDMLLFTIRIWKF